MNGPDLSIVIGFKDWGLRRLVGAVRSLTSATKTLSAEIIVSDYGSADWKQYKDAVEREGARYVHTTTNGVWSRSRALNAGLRVARGKLLATTDADMVFSPDTFNLIIAEFERETSQYIVMQCNDLPEGIDHDLIEAGAFDWEALNRMSTLRPRWGMGGLIVVPREAYVAVRGLDERMQIYGGEDIDFARRLRRTGLKLHWFDDPAARMYHVWHPSSRASADETSAGRAAIALNREIQLHDKTAARNLKSWHFAPDSAPPLVSVVISTANRSHYLGTAILSVLSQTMRDFELLVIDDGSTDDTRSVVHSIEDDRIRYHYQDSSGIAAARNLATTLARGKFIAVMDDDDIMLPSRLEDSLNAIVDGANGSYGGWVDFDASTGTRKFNAGKLLSLESLLFNNSIYLHPTLLVERRWLQAVGYDESFRSGSDYNLAVRLLRSGAKLSHSGKYVLLRRLHDGQITATDSVLQKTAGAISGFWGRSAMLAGDVASAREGRAEKDKAAVEAQAVAEPRLIEFLPDAVTGRQAVVRVAADFKLTEGAQAVIAGLEPTWELRDSGGAIVLREYCFSDLRLDDDLRLRASAGVEIAVESWLKSEGAPVQTPPVGGNGSGTTCLMRSMLEYLADDGSDAEFGLIAFAIAEELPAGYTAQFHVRSSEGDLRVVAMLTRVANLQEHALQLVNELPVLPRWFATYGRVD